MTNIFSEHQPPPRAQELSPEEVFAQGGSEVRLLPGEGVDLCWDNSNTIITAGYPRGALTLDTGEFEAAVVVNDQNVVDRDGMICERALNYEQILEKLMSVAASRKTSRHLRLEDELKCIDKYHSYKIFRLDEWLAGAKVAWADDGSPRAPWVLTGIPYPPGSEAAKPCYHTYVEYWGESLVCFWTHAAADEALDLIATAPGHMIDLRKLQKKGFPEISYDDVGKERRSIVLEGEPRNCISPQTPAETYNDQGSDGAIPVLISRRLPTQHASPEGNGRYIRMDGVTFQTDGNGELYVEGETRSILRARSDGTVEVIARSQEHGPQPVPLRGSQANEDRLDRLEPDNAPEPVLRSNAETTNEQRDRLHAALAGRRNPTPQRRA